VASDDRDRVEELERRVASLEAAVRELTSQRTSPRPALGRPSAPREPLKAPPEMQPLNWLPKDVDLEALVGRYGTLVLATVSALAAVGTFLGWAIANGLLGPSQRIALGLIVAAGLAVGGLRLRARERSFGASLLGLGLAITHVCAWGAGPSLHLVPDWVAFLLAATTSIALAVFAHREADEPLWCVGFSGAAIAPFVTASGKSNLVLLTAYGVAVMASSGYAMGPRRWVIAGRLFLLAAGVYTAALATGYERDLGPLLAMAFPLGAALLGVIPWIDGFARRERLRALGALSALAALRAGMGINMPWSHQAVAATIAAAGVVWLVIVDRTHATGQEIPKDVRFLHEAEWLDGGVLPLAFVAAGVMAFDASARGSGLAMGGASLVLLLTVMRDPAGSLRDAAVFATVLCALIAVLLLERSDAIRLAGAIAILSALCFAANRQWRSVSWTTLGVIGLAWAMLATLGQLIEREAYAYTPFATRPSALALAVLACVTASWRFVANQAPLEVLLRSGVVAWAFIWVHQEIALAFNQTAATLLRVSYYASTSVAAVWIGRARRIPLLRHLGLGLAILAAGTALYGARRLDAIAARIGADLVAAVFLLAIAYWYRRPGGSRPAAAEI
jgi:hypothetical protein